MKTLTKLAAASGALLLAGVTTASAAFIDFTAMPTGKDPGPIACGYKGCTLTGTPADLNFNLPGSSKIPAGAPIAGVNDGVGIDNNEITNDPTKTPAVFEYLTVTFDEKVRLTAAYFLNLFIESDGSSTEVAVISVGSTPGAEDAVVAAQFETFKGGGYAFDDTLSLVGTSFTFWVRSTNDAAGGPDGSLAAINVAAVPLPAGLVLLGTAVGGFGALRRRKKA